MEPSNWKKQTKSPFLIPCRRVGLKRRKSPVKPTTPQSILRSTSSIASSSSPISLHSSSCTLESTSQRSCDPSFELKNLGNTRRRRTLGSCNFRNKGHQENAISKVEITSDNLSELEAEIAEKKRRILTFPQIPETKEACELENLIATWRNACQCALDALLQHIVNASSTEKQNMDMKRLLQHLNIPTSLVHFDIEKEDFY